MVAPPFQGNDIRQVARGYLSCRHPELHTLNRAAVEMAQIVASASSAGF
jgi:hypothetical protein